MARCAFAQRRHSVGHVFRDGNDPERLEESFVMESWLEYLRSRERMTTADSELLATGARPFIRVPDLPRVTHQVYAKEVNSERP